MNCRISFPSNGSGDKVLVMDIMNRSGCSYLCPAHELTTRHLLRQGTRLARKPDEEEVNTKAGASGS
jgi:hypothetical protein